MDTIDVRATTFVRASRDQVWDALTNPKTMQAFHPAGMQIAALPEGGHEIQSPADGATFIREPIISSERGKKIELGFEPKWVEGPYDQSKVTFEIIEKDNACKVALTQSNCAAFGIGDNWDRFLSSMKSYLETGSGLHIPPGGQG